MADVLLDNADLFEQRMIEELGEEAFERFANKRPTEILTVHEFNVFDQILSEVLGIPSAQEAVAEQQLKARKIYSPSVLLALKDLYPEQRHLLERYDIERHSDPNKPFSYEDYALGLHRPYYGIVLRDLRRQQGKNVYEFLPVGPNVYNGAQIPVFEEQLKAITFSPTKREQSIIDDWQDWFSKTGKKLL